MTLSARLVRHPIGGGETTVVEGVGSWRWYVRPGQPPTLDLTWLADADPANVLTGPVEVALEIATDGGNWAEPRDSRFISGRVDWNRLAENAGARRLQLIGVASLLAAAKTSVTTGTVVDGKRELSGTPGAILTTLVDEARGRGVLPHLALGFTPTHDSRGNIWPETITRQFDEGTNLAMVLAGLYEAGLLDHWTQGWTLHAALPATVDHTTGTNPVWIRDAQLADSPDTESWMGLVNKVTVIGEKGARWEFSNPNALTLWGAREQVISAGGVVDEAAARKLADQILAGGQDAARTYTREWIEDSQPAMPGRDLQPGDWVLVDTAHGTGMKMQLADMSLRVDGPDAPLTAFVTAGVVVDDLLGRIARRTRGLEGGRGMILTALPAPITPGTETPAAPVGLAGSASTFIDAEGWTRGRMQITWQPVTTSVDGQSMAIDNYRLWWRVNQAGERLQLAGETSATMMGVDPVPIGVQIAVQVQARGVNGQWGPHSDAALVDVPGDDTPPPTPSTPVISTAPGVVRVGWDGADNTGQQMPGDLAHVEVAVGTTTEPQAVDLLMGAGTVIVAAPARSLVHARLRAVDHAGNASDWTPLVSITVASILDDIDLTQAREDGSLYVDGTIAGSALIGGTITGDLIAGGAITGDLIAGSAVKAEHLEIGAVDRSRLAAGVTGSLDAADAWAARTILEPGAITITGVVGADAAYMRLTATSQEWWAGGVRVAYTDAAAQEMGIRSARIEKQLQVGRHLVESYNEDVTIVRYVG